MITIIKQPTKLYQEQVKKKHMHCRYCGTEWLADAADYLTVNAEVWINNVEQKNYVTNCPICGNKLYFAYNEKGKTWDDYTEPEKEDLVEVFKKILES